jgi:hypothetical protein
MSDRSPIAFRWSSMFPKPLMKMRKNPNTKRVLSIFLPHKNGEKPVYKKLIFFSIWPGVPQNVS